MVVYCSSLTKTVSLSGAFFVVKTTRDDVWNDHQTEAFYVYTDQTMAELDATLI